jgi:glutamate racemase
VADDGVDLPDSATESSAPLGVFDSGLGGLTVVRAVLGALPDERIVYLGDTARVPYGTRSADTVIRYARACARVLIRREVKCLVIACNTVSAVALDLLRAELDLPVVGVVEPGAESALIAAEEHAANGSNGRPVKIGVLGTAGTVASGAYVRAVKKLSTRFEVVAQAAPLLVPLVEEGWLEGEVPRLAVRRYVEPLIEAGASVIVLGCTHYPLLEAVIAQVAAEVAGEPVPVVDSATATADAVTRLLAERRIVPAPRGARPVPALELLVTDTPAGFRAVASRFLGDYDTPQVQQIDIDPTGA